jgi:hypothetical protein
VHDTTKARFGEQKEYGADHNSDVGDVENASTDTADSNVQKVYDLSVDQAIYPIGKSAHDE